MLKHLPRPIIVHFAQTLACPETESSKAAKKRQQSWKGEIDPVPRPLPSFSADNSENRGFEHSSLYSPLPSSQQQQQQQQRTFSTDSNYKKQSFTGNNNNNTANRLKK